MENPPSGEIHFFEAIQCPSISVNKRFCTALLSLSLFNGMTPPTHFLLIHINHLSVISGDIILILTNIINRCL